MVIYMHINLKVYCSHLTLRALAHIPESSTLNHGLGFRVWGLGFRV